MQSNLSGTVFPKPCDFYLFEKLKEFLKEKVIECEETLKTEIINFLRKISKKELKKVYEEWISRLELVIKLEGDYIIK